MTSNQSVSTLQRDHTQASRMVALTNCSPLENSNKVWVCRVWEDGFYESLHGRIGTKLTPTRKQFTLREAERELNKKIQEKIGKGYEFIKDVSPRTSTERSGAKLNLTAVERQQIGSQIKELLGETSELSDRSGIFFNQTTGRFESVVGEIGRPQLEKAKGLLGEVEQMIRRNQRDPDRFSQLVGDYMRMIPHKVGSSYTAGSVLGTLSLVEMERSLLNSIERCFTGLESILREAQQSLEVDEDNGLVWESVTEALSGEIEFDSNSGLIWS